jgi:hypothetical protein
MASRSEKKSTPTKDIVAAKRMEERVRERKKERKREREREREREN